MKKFLEMIEVAKRIIFVDEKTIKNRLSPEKQLEHFYSVAEKCQPFVFTISGETKAPPGMIDDEGNAILQNLDAPFEVFSIEMIGGDVTVANPIDIVEEGMSVNTKAILCFEVAPKQYNYYVYLRIVRQDKVSEVVMLTRCLDALISIYIDRINSEQAGTEHTRERIKIGTGASKRVHTIRKVIHVRPKRDVSVIFSGAKLIDWSQRWFVRGHWRKTETLGKDREGNYCIEGHTWVSEHVKGPEDAPLIKKVRVVDL